MGLALIREDIALELEAAGEICVWDSVRITSQLWFIFLKDRAADRVISALLEVEADVWKSPA